MSLCTPFSFDADDCGLNYRQERNEEAMPVDYSNSQQSKTSESSTSQKTSFRATFASNFENNSRGSMLPTNTINATYRRVPQCQMMSFPTACEYNCSMSCVDPRQPFLSIAPTDDASNSYLRFPQKLWNMVNNCTTGEVKWSVAGNSILIDYPRFQKKYLSEQRSLFKTQNIASFVRQLNLYGFRKVATNNFTTTVSLPSSKKISNKSRSVPRIPLGNINLNSGNDVHEFKHECFIQGREDLLHLVTRRYSPPSLAAKNKENKQMVPIKENKNLNSYMYKPKESSKGGLKIGKSYSQIYNFESDQKPFYSTNDEYEAKPVKSRKRKYSFKDPARQQNSMKKRNVRSNKKKQEKSKQECDSVNSCCFNDLAIEDVDTEDFSPNVTQIEKVSDASSPTKILDPTVSPGRKYTITAPCYQGMEVNSSMDNWFGGGDGVSVAVFSSVNNSTANDKTFTYRDINTMKTTEIFSSAIDSPATELRCNATLVPAEGEIDASENSEYLELNKCHIPVISYSDKTLASTNFYAQKTQN